MSICNNFGKIDLTNTNCITCKVKNSCKREYYRLNKPKKPKPHKHRVDSDLKLRNKLLTQMSLITDPVSTNTIYKEVSKWQEKIKLPKLRKYLNELSKLGYVLKFNDGRSYYWIPAANFSLY
jgi:hypothetical protein